LNFFLHQPRRLPNPNMKTLLLLFPLFAFLGCTETQTGNAKAFLASPTGQAILQHVEQTALVAADSALQQYSETGKVKGEQVAQDSLTSVSHQLRDLHGTEAGSPGAIKQAVAKGSSSPVVTQKVAPAVADAVAKATKEGVPPKIANEAAARGLDKAVAKRKSAKRRPSPSHS
jgi:hypothetical protein